MARNANFNFSVFDFVGRVQWLMTIMTLERNGDERFLEAMTSPTMIAECADEFGYTEAVVADTMLRYGSDAQAILAVVGDTKKDG